MFNANGLCDKGLERIEITDKEITGKIKINIYNMMYVNKNKEVARSYSGRAMPRSFCNVSCYEEIYYGKNFDLVQIVNLYKPFYSRRV